MTVQDRRTAEEIARDVRYLANPVQWTRWPVCPVKRYDGKDKTGFPTIGVVVDSEESRFVVLEVNMFALGTLSREEIKALDRYEYASFSEMVDAGWQVD